tara:strand:+ start:2782 stop:3771 length:990 start_codon:yes stop_codon:yes gene_type:complete
MSYSDSIGYANSLNEAVSGLVGGTLSEAQDKKNEKIKNYNDLLNGSVVPIGDEFVRAGIQKATDGINSGIALGLKKIATSGKTGVKKATTKVGNLIESNNPAFRGTLQDDTIDSSKVGDRITRTLGRNESEQLRNRGQGIFGDDRFDSNIRARPSGSRATGEIRDLSKMNPDEVAEVNRARALQASKRSGQELQQDGGGARPPPAEPAPSATESGGSIDPDDGTRYYDAEEPPTASDPAPVADTENLIKGGEDLEKVDKETKTLKRLKKADVGVDEGDADQGGADILTDIAAVGLGIATSVLEKKLEKKQVQAPPPVVLNTQPSYARGL